MGRKRKAPTYILIYSSDLHSISEDRVYDDTLDDDPKNNLGDQLQCPPADEVLIALRKSFSLTFPRNYLIENIKQALLEIRRIGVEALKPIPEVLTELSLPPIPMFSDDPVQNKVHLFLFVFAKKSDIDISIKVKGKRHRLLDYLGNEDGTALITTLRAVVTDTFSEAFDEDQHLVILQRIREKIGEVLPHYNVCLQAMEVEPIATTAIPIDDHSDAIIPDTAQPSD